MLYIDGISKQSQLLNLYIRWEHTQPIIIIYIFFIVFL